MNEPAFSIVATVIGVVYVLAYAWAQLEILSYLSSLWRENERPRMIWLGILWLVMNCFCFLIAHDVHFAMIRQGRIVLYDLDEWWAKAAAVAVVLLYWLWIVGSFRFAISQRNKIQE